MNATPIRSYSQVSADANLFLYDTMSMLTYILGVYPRMLIPDTKWLQPFLGYVGSLVTNYILIKDIVLNETPAKRMLFLQ
jgi:hypothetical protein